MKLSRKSLFGLLLGVTALLVVLRRRWQPIDTAPLLPAPAPPYSPEPPRIVLPAEVLGINDGVPESAVPSNHIPLSMDSEAEEVAAEVAAEYGGPDQERAVEAPLREREVGGTAPAEADPSDAGEDDEDDESDAEQPIAYCMSCREKQPVNDPHVETLDSGRRALRGTCSVCGAKMNRFLKSKAE